MSAPRRELDPNRVSKLPPLDSLAPQTYPISHVNVTKNWQHIKPGTKTRKYDSNWQTDDERAVLSKSKETNTDRGNEMLRISGKTPVVKVEPDK